MDEKPELFPGFEQFWAPDESAQAIEREVEEKPPYFGLSRPAPHRSGLVYWGPWETAHDGVCVAVRRNSVALRRTKLPVFLQSPSHLEWNGGLVKRTYFSELPPEVLAEVGPLTDITHSKTIAWVKHFVPSAGMLQALTTPGVMVSDRAAFDSMLESTAAYMAIETNAVPIEWVRCINRFAAVMVPCQMNRIWLQEAGVSTPVVVVPHPIALADPIRSVQPSQRQDTFRILNVGKWEPRKNQHVLIGAFLRAFQPNQHVQLVLKTAPFWRLPASYPLDPNGSIKTWLDDHVVKAQGWTAENVSAAIRVFWGVKHSREQIAKLYGMCHAYAQVSLCEGFDLNALDAKAAGMRMTYVPFGGPVDYAMDDDEPIGYGGCAPPPAGYVMPPDTTWPSIGVQDIQVAITRLYERKFEGVCEFDCAPYRIDSVGSQIRKVVDRLAEKVGVHLSECEVE